MKTKIDLTKRVRTVRFFDIKWDTDGEEMSLPSVAEFDIDDPCIDFALDGADLLSDKYGYCVEAFQFEEIAFNGITGRLPGQPKSQKVPAEFTEVLEQLAARLSSDDAKASLELVKNSDELVTWLAANFINF